MAEPLGAVRATDHGPGRPILTSAGCILPGCGKALHIVWVASRPVYWEDGVLELNDSSEAYTSSWSVECEGGHTILTPPDTAEDTYEFGRCAGHLEAASEGEPHDPAWCPYGDLDRLRAVVAPDPVPFQ